MHSETVDYAADVELQGYLAHRPVLDEPVPAVLIAHAWKGQGDFERRKAEQLAELGYVGFAADVYGAGVTADDNEQAAALMQPLLKDRKQLRKRIQAAVRVLRDHPQVDGKNIAAIGFCFGGLTVLELARSGEPVQGVVSFHGLFSRGDIETAGNISAKVLALHGYDDPLAPPEQIDQLAEEMTEAGADWQIHIYGNTMHAFTNPAANDPENGLQYNPVAEARSWQAMRDFLSDVFA